MKTGTHTQVPVPMTNAMLLAHNSRTPRLASIVSTAHLPMILHAASSFSTTKSTSGNKPSRTIPTCSATA
jgi:hypothetical protein